MRAILPILLIVIGCSACAEPEGDATVRAPADAGRVQVRVGERTMAVPTNYLNSVLSSSQREGDVYVTNPVLLVGSAPDFAGRTPANDQAFRAPGSEPLIHVLLDRVRGMTPDAALGNVREWYMSGERISSDSDGADVHLVMRSVRPGQYNSKIGDIYLARDGSFTVCSRVEGVIRSPSCELHTVLGPSFLVIRFGRGRVAEREAIRLAVQQNISEWSDGERP